MRWWWWTWWWWWCWRVAWGSTLRCRLPVCTLWQFPSILLFCVFSFFLFPFTGQTGFPPDRSTWKSVHGFPVYYEGQLSWSCCGQGWNWMCWGHYQRKNDYWLLSIFIFKVWGVIYTRTLVGHMTTLRHDPVTTRSRFRHETVSWEDSEWWTNGGRWAVKRSLWCGSLDGQFSGFVVFVCQKFKTFIYWCSYWSV